jgi:uncharacterized protein YkwD
MRSATRLTMILTLSLLPQLSRTQTNASSSERQLFDSANRERKNSGLPTLKWDEALASAARRHAIEMANHGTISHQFPGEPGLPARATKAGARFTSLAENIAQAPDSAAVHDLWMHSPPHRANLLDPTMDSIGVGAVERNGELFAVADFSKAQ